MHVVSTNRREQMRLSGHPSTGAKKGTVHTLRNLSTAWMWAAFGQRFATSTDVM